jgi:ketosteroid isomerase-like protein/GNAT superfamily N-acetyltransferase
MLNPEQQEAAIALLRRAYAAFNRGEIDATVEGLDPDIEWVEPPEFPGGGTYHGHAGVKAYLTQSREAWAELRSEPERFIPAGDRIVVFVHARVRAQDDPTWLDVRLADVYTFQGGKVVSMHAFAVRRQAIEWTGLRVEVAAPEDIPAIQSLWTEYWDSIGLPHDFQNFADERDRLPGLYAPPRGRLLLARIGGQPAGTAALRPLGESVCEAKRLYVRPLYRSAGIGKVLLVKLIEEARTAGFREMYGDTLKLMTSALRIYDELGFAMVGPYSADPTPDAIYLKLAL